MASVLKAEEILPESTHCSLQKLRIAFRKPGADTPGRFDDLDYDIGNMEATDNHQVNMEVGRARGGSSLMRRNSRRTRKPICSVSRETTPSF